MIKLVTLLTIYEKSSTFSFDCPSFCDIMLENE
jgi:hypothetical protein